MKNVPLHPGGGGVDGGGSHSKPENRPRENGSVITQIKQGVAVLVYDPSTGSRAEIRRTETGLPEWRSSRFREKACLKHTDNNSNAEST